ncbi:hypothetical protein FRC08_015191 [Ceratobasidium sp. 394]|nr:hypothetical protein FRC08_015191 [Ceratobasidium sp. 394]
MASWQSQREVRELVNTVPSTCLPAIRTLVQTAGDSDVFPIPRAPSFKPQAGELEPRVEYVRATCATRAGLCCWLASSSGAVIRLDRLGFKH